MPSPVDPSGGAAPGPGAGWPPDGTDGADRSVGEVGVVDERRSRDDSRSVVVVVVRSEWSVVSRLSLSSSPPWATARPITTATAAAVASRGRA
jgi:hypothetical protein